MAESGKRTPRKAAAATKATPSTRASRAQRTVTAAGTPIEVSDATIRRAIIRKRQAWQQEAWLYYDEIGEVKYAVNFRAHAISRLRLFAAVRPNPDDEPVDVLDTELSGIPENDARRIADLLAEMRSERGGQAELLRRTSTNADVPGDCYIVEVPANTLIDAETEEPISVYEVRSVPFEIRPKGDKWEQFDSTAGKWATIGDGTRMWRMHNPHPSDAMRADSPMRGVLNECDLLLHYTRQLKGEVKSRMNAGLLLIDKDLGFEPPDPSNPDPMTNPKVVAMVTALTSPIANEGSASAVVPHMIFGEQIKDKVIHLKLDRSDRGDIQPLIDQRIQRIAHGLDLPVEIVVGHQETTFANAMQVDRSKFEDHIKPRAIALCDGYTDGYLQPVMTDAGLNYPEVFVYFDATDLLVDPEQFEKAKALREANAISDEAFRRAGHFGEDDAPSENEQLRRWALEATADGPTAIAVFGATGMLEELELPIDVESTPVEAEEEAPPEAPREIGPAPDVNGPPEPEPVTAAAGRRDPLGRRLARIDQALLDRLLVAADIEMMLAVRRAGHRVKTDVRNETALASACKGVEPESVCSTLGRAAISAAGISDDRLLDGAFTDLEVRYEAWTKQAQRSALDAIEQEGGDFGSTDRAAAEWQQDDDRHEGWLLLLGLLLGAARSKLFRAADAASGTVETALGESAGLAVDPGVIRLALQRAGGASAPVEASTMLTGTRPVGLVATGDLMESLVRSSLKQVWNRWVWIYGDPAARTQPFPEHEELDGTEFENFADGALSLPDDSWISQATGGYFPGDHAGCQCIIEPVPADIDTIAAA